MNTAYPIALLGLQMGLILALAFGFIGYALSKGFKLLKNFGRG
jgi:hypothetical protein